MQIRLFFSLMIFVGSYLPLSLILLAQNYDTAALEWPLCWTVWRHDCVMPFKQPVFALSAFATCAVCFAVTLLTLAVVKPKHEIVIQQARHIPTDLMNYTLPYVVSFMSYDYQEMSKFIGLAIFLAWMFWITHRSGQILLNPVLIVFGWRLYEITYRFAADEVSQTGNVLAFGALASGERHRQVAVQDLLIVKPDRSKSD